MEKWKGPLSDPFHALSVHQKTEMFTGVYFSHKDRALIESCYNNNDAHLFCAVYFCWVCFWHTIATCLKRKSQISEIKTKHDFYPCYPYLPLLLSFIFQSCWKVNRKTERAFKNTVGGRNSFKRNWNNKLFHTQLKLHHLVTTLLHLATRIKIMSTR